MFELELKTIAKMLNSKCITTQMDSFIFKLNISTFIFFKYLFVLIVPLSIYSFFNILYMV